MSDTTTLARDTTPAADHAPRSLPGRTVLRHAMAAEWTRLRGVRSTWWSLLAGLVMMLFVGVAFGLDMDDVTPVWVAGELGIVFAQFALFVPAMLAVTAEYSTGAVRSTLLAVPRRGVLALARTLVAVGAVASAGFVLALAADVASWVALGPRAEVVTGDLAASLGAVAMLVAAGALLAVGVGNVLRSSAGTLTTVFLLWLVLPMMLPAFGVSWLATIGNHLPGAAAMAFLDAFGDPVMSTTRAGIVLAAWLVAATAAGLWSLLRRDAA